MFVWNAGASQPELFTHSRGYVGGHHFIHVTRLGTDLHWIPCSWACCHGILHFHMKPESPYRVFQPRGYVLVEKTYALIFFFIIGYSVMDAQSGMWQEHNTHHTCTSWHLTYSSLTNQMKEQYRTILCHWQIEWKNNIIFQLVGKTTIPFLFCQKEPGT